MECWAEILESKFFVFSSSSLSLTVYSLGVMIFYENAYFFNPQVHPLLFLENGPCFVDFLDGVFLVLDQPGHFEYFFLQILDEGFLEISGFLSDLGVDE